MHLRPFYATLRHLPDDGGQNIGRNTW
jgi:hypothetical protein